jgi:hypothetical protein
MILHPGILALLLTAVLVLGMVLYGAYTGAIVLARWDIDSSSEAQLALETWLLFRLFLGLDPRVITSCCGALFSGTGAGVAAELADLPAFPLMLAFFGGVALYLVAGVLVLRLAEPRLRYLIAA